MERQSLNEEEYIAKMNEELKKHYLYKYGMEIIPSPPGAQGNNITGYYLKGATEWPKILADVSFKINQTYKLVREN